MISEDDGKYLARFPIYQVRTMRGEVEEALSGPFAQYFMEDIGNITDQGYPNKSHAEIPWEIMACIHTYEYIVNQFKNDQGKRFWRQPAEGSHQDARKVTVILFGQFHLEETTLPAKVGDLPNAGLIASLARPPLTETAQRDSLHEVDIPALLRCRAADLEGINFSLVGAQEPFLQVFTFMLRNYYGLQLRIEDEQDEIDEMVVSERSYRALLHQHVFDYSYCDRIDPKFDIVLQEVVPKPPTPASDTTAAAFDADW